MNRAMEKRHLTDAELLRALEDAGSDELEDTGSGRDRAELVRHLEACRPCAEALEALERDSQLIHQYLGAADFEDGGRPLSLDAGRRREARAERDARTGEARRWGARARPDGGRRFASSWLKAAAIIILVAGPLAAFPDVRSWVVERVAGPAETSVADVPADAPTLLRFTPNPGNFVVRFPAGASGAITLERSDGTEAELRATGGDPETVVSASSLEIRNIDEGRYRLRLPATVTGAWVVVGERTVSVDDGQIDRRAVVTLDG